MKTTTEAGNVSYDLKRFAGIKRDYSNEDVEKLKGTFNIEYTLCKSQSQKLWNLLNTEPYVNTLGSLSGNQAVQHAKAGLKAIYLSGWQVAADANSAGEMYPDQSLYPYDSAPKLVEAMNNALIRADQIQHMEITKEKNNDQKKIDYKIPIIADGEAGFGGPLKISSLLKFANIVGAKNSINFLKTNVTKALDLLKPRDPNDIIEKLKGSADNFHIYTFGGLKETNKWLTENNYA